MGGEVEAHSELHQGSTFSFVACFEATPEPPSEPVEAPRQLAQRADPVLGSTPAATNGNHPAGEATAAPHDDSRTPSDETGLPAAIVLVAEDSPTNQAVAVKMLERAGVRADVARDGREAVEMLARSNYSAVLMDCQMPRLDGYGATAEIRGIEGADRYMPIIAMTANAMKGDRERCLEAGMDDYLSKPVMKTDLQAVIDRWVTHPHGAADPTELET